MDPSAPDKRDHSGEKQDHNPACGTRSPPAQTSEKPRGSNIGRHRNGGNWRNERRNEHHQRHRVENRDQKATEKGKERVQYTSCGRLPDGWVNYVAIGSNVSGTPFLPFKTPLRAEFKSKLNGVELFEVDTLLKCVVSNNRKLGLVIDLTNTDRYYDSRIWQKNGIYYVKMRNHGQDVHLQNGLFNRFRNTVDGFRRRHPEDNLLIGVHCTHGLNRTGYLICRYMIEVLKVNAREAIWEFERSRGYAIEKDSYVNSLKEIALSLQAEQTKALESVDEWEDMTHRKRTDKLLTSKKSSWLEQLRDDTPSLDSERSNSADHLAAEIETSAHI
ncbi:hypothetical protein QR680_001347 [Steinernema hermaphroditum]|uniref:Tyrosine specific protein phosphatases domain-containing protein n=1 Tax=Steinernema hermaphroditum TaxID=289476 RepID=A0AA39GXX0_9BILA|nr:hypothetical protein QR680_001347 [Steinernema hermaphroditum]